MSPINWQQEEQRLRGLYRSVSDVELTKIAVDPAALTDVARAVLEEERLSRGRPSLAAEAEQRAEKERNDQGREPVLIRRYRDLPEASIAQSMLESAGIESYLADENMVRLDWFYSNLIGGIKLIVHREDLESSTKLLGEATPDKFSVDGIGEYQQPLCPHCGASDTSFDGLNRPVTYGVMYLTGLPIPVIRKGWKCHKCGHAWEQSTDSETLDG